MRVYVCFTNVYEGTMICFFCSNFMSMTRQLSAHTRARAHAEITRTPLSCGGDADLLSLLRQSYLQTCIRVYVCVRVYVDMLFVCFSEYT